MWLQKVTNPMANTFYKIICLQNGDKERKKNLSYQHTNQLRLPTPKNGSKSEKSGLE
jgi:hypothetical protein